MGGKVINSEDDELDERTRRRWKRRGLANGTCKPELFWGTPKKSTKCNAQVDTQLRDPDYEVYLRKIQDKDDWIEHYSDVIDDVDNGGCKRGHSDSGNGNCDIRDDVDARVVEDGDDRNEQCGGDDGDDGDDENGHLGDGDVNTRFASDGDGDIRVKCLNDDVDGDDIDPQYKMFWDNLREDGNSYVLRIFQEDGRVKEIRYHQDNGLRDEVNADTTHSQGKEKTKLKNNETAEVEAPELKSSVKKRNIKMEAQEPVSDGTNVCSSKRPCLEVSNTPESFRSSQLKEKTETRKNSKRAMNRRNSEDCPEKRNDLEKKSLVLKKNEKESAVDPLSGRTNGCSHEQSGSKYLWSPEGGCNREAESDSDLTDDNYREFLSCSKDDGKGVVFTSRSYGPIRYDSDEESSSDSDVVVLDRDPHEGYRTPIIFISQRSAESNSQFRQGIVQDLKRPYHLEEYLNLLEDWSRQRPAKCHDKNLRNGKVKSYALEGEFGKSYQEMYKDLAGKMEAVTGDDRPRKLNLLRGFFYWLKNLSQQGSFKPWKDKACLKVLPRSTK